MTTNNYFFNSEERLVSHCQFYLGIKGTFWITSPMNGLTTMANDILEAAKRFKDAIARAFIFNKHPLRKLKKGKSAHYDKLKLRTLQKTKYIYFAVYPPKLDLRLPIKHDMDMDDFVFKCKKIKNKLMTYTTDKCGFNPNVQNKTKEITEENYIYISNVEFSEDDSSDVWTTKKTHVFDEIKNHYFKKQEIDHSDTPFEPQYYNSDEMKWANNSSCKKKKTCTYDSTKFYSSNNISKNLHSGNLLPKMGIYNEYNVNLWHRRLDPFSA
ncbi:hypothetical protein H8356DRAFT_1351435 [Neocallimastix lanati (nom. inval.)]|nr:hypothetical protein H8356DRAFT_1351435 [Neocallimastix sp. JGI-2020a]